MPLSARFRIGTLALFVILIMTAMPAALARPATDVDASPDTPPVAPAETPDTFVGGGVESFSVNGTRLVWHRPAYCPSPPPRSVEGDQPQSAPAAAADPVQIVRLPTYGGLERVIYSRNDPRDPGVCNPYRIWSNVASDEGYIYWLDDSGLVRLSVNANPGDAPEVLNSAVGGPDAGQIVVTDDYVYGYKGQSLFRIGKHAPNPGISLGSSGSPISNVQAHGTTFYYILNGTLYRRNSDTSDSLTMASGVTGYYAEGPRLTCTPDFVCVSSNYVYVAQGRTIRRYNNNTERWSSLQYTSADPQATVYRMTSTRTHLFIFETRFIPCSPFPCFGGTYNDVLLRSLRGFGDPSPLYVRTSIHYNIAPTSELATDGTFIFWKEMPEVIRRLPANAAELQVEDMYPTSIEITQGIQRSDNSVVLIQNRTTYVRVFVRSASASVNGVTMMLSGSWDGGGGTLAPVNNVGKTLTVRAAPDPNNIDHAFLFELPWSWTTQSNLRLRAEVNPNRYPLEPNYSNNVATAGPFAFQPSPRLAVQFISFGFVLNNTSYLPRFIEDIIGNYSYIRRTYPLASRFATMSDPSPGFRPNLWIMYDDGLASRILQPGGVISSPECSRPPFLVRDDKGNITADNRNLCASAYTNSRLKQIRADEGLDSNIFMYGMISDGAGFPRGQEGGDRVSSGPAGPGWEGYYAAHEIGHSLGRPHPNSGSDDPATTAVEGCGHSRSDPSYPYASATRAPIGPNDGSVRGFDGGDPELRIAREVKPATLFNDYMSYCGPYWISDYTYRAMYDNMRASSSRATTAAVRPRQAGDWLSVYGVIGADSQSAYVHSMRRTDSIGTIPPRQDGPYAIQLLDGDTVLAEYPFTPDEADDASALLNFGQVVPFADGTGMIRIVHRDSGRVLVERAVSGNAPTVANVRLVNATVPVTGSVQLAWDAEDQDGDSLTFDVAWSRDGGTNFQPLHTGVRAEDVTVDTTRLGGGNGVFRVTASDGILTGSAQSEEIELAAKPPTVRITSPGETSSVEWAQLVNFSADVIDLQDGTLPDASLVWRDARGNVLGTGPLVSRSDLPVGTNPITLTATNSAGLSATDTVTVTVGDTLDLPGPILSVSPTTVGWTSPADSTDPLEATLDISNVGGGTLAWTASDDQEWLTLSATEGSAPATITLRADPTSFVSNSIYEANVTITSTVDGATQTITVPVTVWRSSAAIGEPLPPPRQQVYMPLIRR